MTEQKENSSSNNSSGSNRMLTLSNQNELPIKDTRELIFQKTFDVPNSIHNYWDDYIVKVWNEVIKPKEDLNLKEIILLDKKHAFFRFLFNPNYALKYLFDYLAIHGCGTVRFFYDDFIKNNLYDIYDCVGITSGTLKTELYRQTSSLFRIGLLESEIVPVQKNKNAEFFIAPFCSKNQYNKQMLPYIKKGLLLRPTDEIIKAKAEDKVKLKKAEKKALESFIPENKIDVESPGNTSTCQLTTCNNPARALIRTSGEIEYFCDTHISPVDVTKRK
jgi:hypothetical protein